MASPQETVSPSPKSGRRGLWKRAAKPDLAYWAKLPSWHFDEAVALSLGCSPEITSWQQVEPLISKSEIARDYARKREHLYRAQARKELKEPVPPGFFLSWALRSNFQVDGSVKQAVFVACQHNDSWINLYDRTLLPPNKRELELTPVFMERLAQIQIEAWEHALRTTHLQDFVERRDIENEILRLRIDNMEIQELRKQNADLEELRRKNSELTAQLEASGSPLTRSPFLPKERDSLLKLVLGMAIGGYRYNPSIARSSVTKEIAGDVINLGLSLDEDTVRKHLKAAFNRFGETLGWPR